MNRYYQEPTNKIVRIDLGIKNVRKYIPHRISKQLTNNDVIVSEKINIKNMTEM